jgi:hypothetical protein
MLLFVLLSWSLVAAQCNMADKTCEKYRKTLRSRFLSVDPLTEAAYQKEVDFQVSSGWKGK